jgi:signal transduction histidine kinase
VGIALAQGIHPMAFIVDDLWFQASTAAALFAISPVVLIVAERSPWLVPLLVVPVATVYWGATASLEKTRLVTRLKESLEHEKELSRVKDEFVAVVSHELRTPLTSIQGYVKTLLQLPDDLGDEQQRSFLQAVDRQSDRLRRLIEQLLIVGRLESHVEPLSVSFVSFEDLVSLIVEELRPRANGHTFDLRFTRGLPLVETNEAKVHQILSNLVENALKYAPPDTRVTVHAIKTDDGILVTVEDEGPGIPAESQDRVFERFYQVDSSITRSVGGTGLGLYICRKMADTIGARLWLDRSGPDGSAFCLLVPRIPPFDAVRPGERPASLARRRLAQSMTASVWPGSTT